MMGHFRQLPRGMKGFGENIRRDMVCVDLDDLALLGNRAQRRFARKKLTQLQHTRSAANPGVSTRTHAPDCQVVGVSSSHPERSNTHE